MGLNILLIGGIECLASNSVQAFQIPENHVTYLQATQPSSNAQSTATSGSQSTASSQNVREQIVGWIQQNQLPIGSVTIIILSYLGILWLNPRLLLKVIPVTEIKIPMTEIKVPLGVLIWLKYQPRVLDAWVSERIHQVESNFEDRLTVKERVVHIPIPVELDGKKPAIANFTPNDLKAVFSKQFTRLVIVGEGGVGKTSFACQIAKWAMTESKDERLCNHRMIPVLIEEELEPTEGGSPLLEAIALQVKNLRDDEKPVAEELLKQLLEKRRILVIVDHLSEMSEATQKATRLRDASSPVNALIVTSRTEDILGKEITYTTLKPQRVSGKQLSIFMDAYLTQRGKRDLFNDPEYFDVLRRLSQIVTDERDITVLFAKLYADQMIAVAEGLVIEDLPDNIPDLMLSYVNEVNREKDNKLDDNIVQRDLKVIAWECLKQTFKPETAEREDVIECLAALEGEGSPAKESAKKRLKYLEDRLALIRTVSPTKIKIRFVLDPLAEYLAGLNLVELYGEDEQAWRSFLKEAKSKPGTLEEIRGFLLATRDCYIAKTIETKTSSSVIEELNKLAALDLEILKRKQLKQRVRDLASDLLRIDARDREYAAKELGNIGSAAKASIPHLISRVLQDDSVSVRRCSIKAIKRIGLETDTDHLKLLEALRDSDEEVCTEVVEVLSTPKITVEIVVSVLIETLKKRVQFPKDESGLVRRRHTIHRSLHGAIEQALIRAGSIAVPIVIQILNDKSVGVRDTAMIVLQGIGGNKTLGPHAGLASLALAEILESDDVGDRRGVCFALQEICSIQEETLVSKNLTKALYDADLLVRVLTARILMKVKPQMTEHLVSGLVNALRSEDSTIRLYACVAIGDTNLATQEVISALKIAYDDSEERVRQVAFKALNKISP
ncbi:MAG: HEAT repeat domain-containing protein [Oculatellaceae cyanobacterium bins.114]|nr:HEAT repeat domain-containing protein [Oculatellaceae cyanobacterium bins.114]